MNRNLTAIAMVFSLFLLTIPAIAREPADRKPSDDVNGADVRSRPGLHPGENILFNGWGVAPAGEHIKMSDMPMKMLITPDQKYLLSVSGGFNNTGLTLVSLADKKLIQFVPIKESWNGLAFSSDGRRVFVSGGDEGIVHVFEYSPGKLGEDHPITPDPKASNTFLAGLAVDTAGGKIYVCNEGNHEIWVLDEQTLALETKIAVGQHPHSCIIGADKQHLYVSNWGSRSLSVIDMEKRNRVRDLVVGIRPNDMTLAPDGRLFVACAGDNTVHVIQTKILEKPGDTPGPTRRLWDGTREIISTSLYPQSPEGSTPDALAISPRSEERRVGKECRSRWSPYH